MMFRPTFRFASPGAVLACLVWACSTLGKVAAAAELPTLQGVLTGEGMIRLELRGTANVNYAIEGSRDLSAWQSITNGASSNGVLRVERPLSELHQFFRAREGGSTNVPGFGPVVPLLSTNSSTSFLASTNGGSAVLYAQDGTELKLTIPPMTVAEPEMVTVTLVTNLTGLPFGGGIVAAVRVEPDSLALWGAATLEIALRPELDRRRIVSFTAKADGSGFHLTPDRVTAASVLIPVVKFGLIGSALAAPAELQPANRLAVTGGTSVSGRLKMASSGCFPEEAAEAEFWNEHLSGLMAGYSQKAAAALAAARQSQLSGETGDVFDYQVALDEAEADACSLISESISPIMGDAQTNCGLAKVLIRQVLAIDRQRQLLGIAEDPSCPSALGSLPLCAIMKNCVKEIKDCCEAGARGRQQIASIFEIVRQEQLLGLECLTAAEIDAAVDACSNGKWTGTLSLKVTGNESESNPQAGESEVRKLTEEFQGQVTSAIEFSFGESTSVNLVVEGRLSFSLDETRILVGGSECGGFFRHEHDSGVANGNTAFIVVLQMSPGSAPTVTITHDPGQMPQGRQTRYMFERSGVARAPGGKDCLVTTYSDTDTDPLVHMSTSSVFGAAGKFENNTFSGTAQVPEHQLRIDGSGSFAWSFERHPERQ